MLPEDDKRLEREREIYLATCGPDNSLMLETMSRLRAEESERIQSSARIKAETSYHAPGTPNESLWLLLGNEH